MSKPKTGQRLKADLDSLRQACQVYLNDNRGLYPFDPDHAVLAYPLAVIEKTFEVFHQQGLPAYGIDDMSFFRKLLSDKKGPMSHILSIIEK
jgi:hypothetical protein